MKATLQAVLSATFCRPLSVGENHLVGKYGRTQGSLAVLSITQGCGILESYPPASTRKNAWGILMSKEPET